MGPIRRHFEPPAGDDAGDRTGWLGCEDSNFRIRRRSGGEQALTLRCCANRSLRNDWTSAANRASVSSVDVIQKWLKAGVLDDGVLTVSDRRTGQGSVISPFLANVYLHYVFELWAERWRHREAVGNVIIVPMT
jgi:hypothetical protein